MCTEKDYSGATTGKIGKNAKTNANTSKQKIETKEKSNEKSITKDENSVLSKTQIESYKKAGKIAQETKEYAKSIIKKDMLLSEIAEKIDAKIISLRAELAFPVNLSIDDVAAHYTPSLRDDKKATGLLKVDLGVHVKGCVCDIAFSIDLSEDKKYTKLIEASEKALKSALEEVKSNKDKSELKNIGKSIEKTIKNSGFTPIVNLSGHSLSEYMIHAGITIPNIDNSSNKTLGEGAFAIEPFSTLSTGTGKVYDGAGSNIYHIVGEGQVRDNFSRDVLEYINENKRTLPFSQRELEKKFGTKALIAISNLKRAGIIEEYAQLIESSHSPVSQAETSILVYNNIVEVLCE